MNIVTVYGDAVEIVPENGYCKLTGDNIDCMIDCPSGEFDGDCCPEICNYYVED